MNIKDYVDLRKKLLKDKVEAFGKPLTLVIIQVNEDFASSKYIKGKLADAAEVGINAIHRAFPESISEEDLLQEISKVNNDPLVHGLIVQLPLPRHINEEVIKQAVNPKKDVDGFHPLSPFSACTPLGIVNYLKANEVKMRDQNVVIFGRSNIVGKPAAALFLKEDANVTILHSKTSDANKVTYLKNADIVVVAVGKKGFLTGEHLKKSAIIVDVGINANADGTISGDALPNLDVFLQTPVPRGVGLLTRLTLLENVWEARNNGI